jgi:hypothetical protein
MYGKTMSIGSLSIATTVALTNTALVAPAIPALREWHKVV